ncbi:biotin/lipoyl-binding protein [Salicibibacter cibarius]|uniref:Biotin/lipoyl-binding protein n=1 Tax=Salicibibacter cibarius TaxID=2743000 RepID=A0A7T6Z7V1_9BACI|nr:biotin/lipoyl-binding protein [Salicibibacter cibarius]
MNVMADLSGSVWKIEVEERDRVNEGDVLLIMESMKMEIPLTASEGGVIKEIRVKVGDMLSEGNIAIVMESDDK